LKKLYEYIIYLPYIFTPYNTCKGFSIYFIYIYSTLRGWPRYSLQVKKKEIKFFYQEFRWNPIISTVEKSWRLYIVTYPVHLWFPSITSTASAVCHVHTYTYTNTHPEIYFYTVNKITRWKWAVPECNGMSHDHIPTPDEVLTNTAYEMNVCILINVTRGRCD